MTLKKVKKVSSYPQKLIIFFLIFIYLIIWIPKTSAEPKSSTLTVYNPNSNSIWDIAHPNGYLVSWESQGDNMVTIYLYKGTSYEGNLGSAGDYETSELVDLTSPSTMVPGTNYRIKLEAWPSEEEGWSDYFEIIDSSKVSDDSNTDTSTIDSAECNKDSDFEFSTVDSSDSEFLGSTMEEDKIVLIDHFYEIQSNFTVDTKILFHFQVPSVYQVEAWVLDLSNYYLYKNKTSYDSYKIAGGSCYQATDLTYSISKCDNYTILYRPKGGTGASALPMTYRVDYYGKCSGGIMGDIDASIGGFIGLLYVALVGTISLTLKLYSERKIQVK